MTSEAFFLFVFCHEGMATGGQMTNGQSSCGGMQDLTFLHNQLFAAHIWEPVLGGGGMPSPDWPLDGQLILPRLEAMGGHSFRPLLKSNRQSLIR